MLYSFSIVIQNLTLTPPATLSKVKILLRKKFNIDLDKRSSLRLSRPVVLLSDPDRAKLEAYAEQLYSFGLDVKVIEEKVKELEVRLKSEALLSPIPESRKVQADIFEGIEKIAVAGAVLNNVPKLNIRPADGNKKMQVVEKDYFTVVRAPAKRLSQAIVREVKRTGLNKKILLFVLLGYSVFFLMQINDERQKKKEFDEIQKYITEMNLAK